MMDHMEMAEKLVKKANISLSEAKEVLERHNWDMLEAMIELERAGKTYESAAAAHSGSGEKSYETVHATASSGNGEHRGWQQLRTFFRTLIDKGLSNHFIVTREDKQILDVPVLVLVFVTIFLFHLTVFLLIVGMFCGCRYAFHGRELGTESINNGMQRASDVAQDIAEQVRSSVRSE